MANGDAAQVKKGLPALAWIGIGCGVIILIGAIALVAGGVFVAKKVKDVAGDFEKNPALASARMIVKLNPEWEEVSTDDKAGTITVREKKTGKEMTFGLDDLAKGRVTLSSEGKSYTVEAGGTRTRANSRSPTSPGRRCSRPAARAARRRLSGFRSTRAPAPRAVW